MTTMMAFHSGHTLPEAAPAAMPGASPEAIRVFITAAFGGAGVPLPAVLGPQAFLQAQYLAAGKPIPKWLASHAATSATCKKCGGAACTCGSTAKASDPFEGREVVGTYLAPNGELVKVVRVGAEEAPAFAAPTPWHATQLDGPGSIEQRYPDAHAPEGDPHGDEKIIRRRRALELERLIMAARKKANRGTPTERERWDQELQNLSSELEAIREAERRERHAYKQI